jgi:hypothetical protein
VHSRWKPEREAEEKEKKKRKRRGDEDRAIDQTQLD